jgi:DNA polymerase III delta prime subunit
MQQHAFVVAAGGEEGIGLVTTYVHEVLGMKAAGNPDVLILRYDLFSIDDARRVNELAAQGGFLSESKALIITTNRIYHEAQNALLKLFEEPPRGTHIFLILPTLGALLPTLRSRVQVLTGAETPISSNDISEAVHTFIRASKEQRSALIKRIASADTEGTGRAYRDEAVSLVNGIERVAYHHFEHTKDMSTVAVLRDITILRAYLYERSAPVRMILEHIALVLPRNLV